MTLARARPQPFTCNPPALTRPQPIFSSGGIHHEALDRIVHNMQSVQLRGPRLLGPGSSNGSGAALAHLMGAPSPLASNNIVSVNGRFSDAEQRLSPAEAGACEPGQPAPAALDTLPALKAFTFLRLSPEMLLPGYSAIWYRFVQRVLATQ